MIVLDEYPTETPPAPENDKPAGSVVALDDVTPVVLPSATKLNPPWLAALVALTMMLPAENPTLTIPAPSKETVLASAVCDDVVPVVFPTANRPSVCAD